MNANVLKSLKKSLKNLKKKCVSLETDFKWFEESLKASINEHENVPEHKHGYNRISGFG
jgi:hypothetical protein